MVKTVRSVADRLGSNLTVGTVPEGKFWIPIRMTRNGTGRIITRPAEWQTGDEEATLQTTLDSNPDTVFEITYLSSGTDIISTSGGSGTGISALLTYIELDNE